MDKQEFFDKIDKIREIVDAMGKDIGNNVEPILHILDELREDAEQLLEDEYDLGLNHGWNHTDKDEV